MIYCNTGIFILRQSPRGRLNIKMSSYESRNSHYKEETVSDHNLIFIIGISIPGTTAFRLSNETGRGLIFRMVIFDIYYTFRIYVRPTQNICGWFFCSCVLIVYVNNEIYLSDICDLVTYEIALFVYPTISASNDAKPTEDVGAIAIFGCSWQIITTSNFPYLLYPGKLRQI